MIIVDESFKTFLIIFKYHNSAAINEQRRRLKHDSCVTPHQIRLHFNDSFFLGWSSYRKSILGIVHFVTTHLISHSLVTVNFTFPKCHGKWNTNNNTHYIHERTCICTKREKMLEKANREKKSQAKVEVTWKPAHVRIRSRTYVYWTVVRQWNEPCTNACAQDKYTKRARVNCDRGWFPKRKREEPVNTRCRRKVNGL
jgi:hypothetical protein